MKLCICRNISDKDVTDHLDKNPHLLGQNWKAVSFNMSQESMACGTCTDAGDDFILTHSTTQLPCLKLANG